MRGKLVFALGLLVVLSPLLYVKFIQVEVKAPDRYQVHNLDTGLNYGSIQDAIDASETLDGHTIFVEAGTYYESVSVHKSLSLIGENRRTTFIDGNRSGTVADITAINVTISDLTIRNAGFQSPIAGAILLNKTMNCEIRNVIIADCDPCGLTMFYSASNKVLKSEFVNNTWSLVLVSSNESRIVDNVISGSSWGIGLGGPEGSSRNALSGNHISNIDHYGIDVFGFDNKVSSNQISNNLNGILLDMANGNLVISNNISNNSHNGIALIRSSENNTIIENRIQSNEAHGVFLDVSGNNTFYHNNFINNTILASVLGVPCAWHNGHEGNYWSNYLGVDSNHDGIGDTPHTIDGMQHRDAYPLMGMFSGFNTSLGCSVNVISNSTIENFEYLVSNSTIKMLVSNTTVNQNLGFCRICIPHGLIDPGAGPLSVVIDDGQTPALFFNNTLYDNGTHGWIYFAYPHSTHKIDIVQEFPSLLILPLFVLTTLLAVIVYRRKQTI